MQHKFIVPSLSALAVAGLFFTPCAQATSEAPTQTDLDGVLVTPPAQPVPGVVEASPAPAQDESGYLGTAASYAYAGIANTLYYGTLVGPVYSWLTTPAAPAQPVAEESKPAEEAAPAVATALTEGATVDQPATEQAAPAPVVDIEDLATPAARPEEPKSKNPFGKKKKKNK